MNKLFRPDGTDNRTFMSKKGVVAAEIEQVLDQTSSVFASNLRSQGDAEFSWDDLDLREVEGKQQQIGRIKQWGKFTGVRIKKC